MLATLHRCVWKANLGGYFTFNLVVNSLIWLIARHYSPSSHHSLAHFLTWSYGLSFLFLLFALLVLVIGRNSECTIDQRYTENNVRYLCTFTTLHGLLFLLPLWFYSQRHQPAEGSPFTAVGDQVHIHFDPYDLANWQREGLVHKDS